MDDAFRHEGYSMYSRMILSRRSLNIILEINGKNAAIFFFTSEDSCIYKDNCITKNFVAFKILWELKIFVKIEFVL